MNRWMQTLCHGQEWLRGELIAAGGEARSRQR